MQIFYKGIQILFQVKKLIEKYIKLQINIDKHCIAHMIMFSSWTEPEYETISNKLLILIKFGLIENFIT